MDTTAGKEKLLIQLQLIMYTMALLSHVLFGQGRGDILKVVFAAFAGFFSCWLKYYIIKAYQNDQIKAWSKIRLIDLITMVIYLLSYTFNSVFAFLFPLSIVGSTWANDNDQSKYFLKTSLVVYGCSFVFFLVTESSDLEHLIPFLLNTSFIYFFCSFIIQFLSERKEYMNQLTEANSRLNRKVAEFYTLSQLQTAIKSIHNTEELLKTVNDMIIGVVGPTFSSVVLGSTMEGSETEISFELAATNLHTGLQQTFVQKDVPAIWDIPSLEHGLMGTTASGHFIQFSDPNVRSYLVVPLTIQNKKVGMIVVQHYIQDALMEDHLKLVRLVAGDLSISLENTDLYEKMKKMATLDGLTMVYNRMYFKNIIDDEFKKAVNNYPLSIAICDADYFKLINDNYGHIFGDHVLQVIAERLQNNIREGDILARYGGEEFVIIFPHCSLDEAFHTAERLRGAIAAKPIEDKYHSVQVTMSFGIASYPEHGSSSRRVLSAADHALYIAKGEGRNCTRSA